jgi:hypothetical protein
MDEANQPKNIPKANSTNSTAQQNILKLVFLWIVSRNMIRTTAITFLDFFHLPDSIRANYLAYELSKKKLPHWNK